MPKKYAELTVEGAQSVKEQVARLCGRDWNSYERAFQVLEERASMGESISYEIQPHLTISGRPEFVRLDKTAFNFLEIEE